MVRKKILETNKIKSCFQCMRALEKGWPSKPLQNLYSTKLPTAQYFAIMQSHQMLEGSECGPTNLGVASKNEHASKPNKLYKPIMMCFKNRRCLDVHPEEILCGHKGAYCIQEQCLITPIY